MAWRLTKLFFQFSFLVLSCFFASGSWRCQFSINTQSSWRYLNFEYVLGPSGTLLLLCFSFCGFLASFYGSPLGVSSNWDVSRRHLSSWPRVFLVVYLIWVLTCFPSSQGSSHCFEWYFQIQKWRSLESGSPGGVADHGWYLKHFSLL